MNIVWAVTLAALAAQFAPVTATAAPFVGTADSAVAELRLRGSDGAAYRVVVAVERARPAGAAESRALTVEIGKCSKPACAETDGTRSYVRPLSPTEVAANDDFSSVTVRTSFMGAPLVFTWTADAAAPPSLPNVRIYAPVFSSSGGSPPVPAGVTAQLLRLSCPAAGAVTRAVVVSAMGYAPADGQPPPSRPSPAFAAKGARRPVCLK